MTPPEGAGPTTPASLVFGSHAHTSPTSTTGVGVDAEIGGAVEVVAGDCFTDTADLTAVWKVLFGLAGSVQAKNSAATSVMLRIAATGITTHLRACLVLASRRAPPGG